MDSNILIKCLGKTLKTEIKLIMNVEMKCLDSNNKDIENPGKESGVSFRKKTICLGTEQIYILDDTMKKKFDIIPYHLLNYIDVDKKSKQSFFVYIKPNVMMKNCSIVKLQIRTDYRGQLIKSLMCYYSVFYMYKFSVMRTLFVNNDRVNEKEEKKEEQVFTKMKSRTLRNYIFFFYGYVQSEYNNSYFKMKYDLGKEEKRPKNEENLSPECEVTLEISDLFPMGRFDLNKDEKDLSFYAYESFLRYMRNTLKVNRYWIIKNKIYFKKMNLVEDVCQWEGWTIEARTSDPFYKNYIFVFLRRKFLPPYYDSYQNFQFILAENCSRENFEMNPAAYKLMELMTGSLHSVVVSSSTRDSQLFLKAKVDSLLVDEETMYYYQFSQKIIGDDIHRFGFKFLHSLFAYFELTLKEKIEPYKQVLKEKFKQFELGDKPEGWTFENKSYKFMDKINEFIDKKIKSKKSSDEISLSSKNKENSESPLPDDSENNLISTTNTGTKKSDKVSSNKIDSEKQMKIKRNWRSKVMRFISYCLNGGLTDFMMTYEKFITDIYNKSQSTNNDLQEVIYCTINLIEYDQPDSKHSKEKISALSENSKLMFNEEALAVTIRTGFLAKVLSETNLSAYPKFLNIILTNYCSNKILNAVLEYLKTSSDLAGEDQFMSEERKELMRIIPPIIKIFSDKRRCPITHLLCCKCLCFLSCKKSDEVFKKKIVFEGNIVSVIAEYLEIFDFDEKLVLCCLDLFSFVMNEPELQILEHLYGYNDRLFERLKKFLEPTGVPGAFYSQRIIIKILTIFLNLTNKIEAEVKPRINSQYKIFFDLLLGVIDEEKKLKVIDPREEESYILEFKTYWLLCILTFKNGIGKEYLNSIGIKVFIEEKSKKFIKLINMINANRNKGLSESKITAISKNISKFFEFVYYLIVNEKEEVIQFKKDSVSFMALKKKVDEFKSNLVLQEKESSVFDWIEKIFKLTDEEYI